MRSKNFLTLAHKEKIKVRQVLTCLTLVSMGEHKMRFAHVKVYLSFFFVVHSSAAQDHACTLLTPWYVSVFRLR